MILVLAKTGIMTDSDGVGKVQIAVHRMVRMRTIIIKVTLMVMKIITTVTTSMKER